VSTSQPPRLLTADETARLRARRSDPQYAPAWQNLQARADAALTDGLRPADRAAGWGHAYYCPEHAAPLEFDPDEPHRHRCPVDGVVHTGEDFDAGWRVMLNARLMSGMDACALAWLATDDRRYLNHVAGLLTDYADRYPTMPEYGKHVGKGRITGQSLEEAVWAIGAARAYDAVRAGLTAGQRTHIEQHLLAELGRHLTKQLMGKIHNIECWHLASLATLGAVLDDDELVDRSVQGEFGLPAQFREGILPDGWWAEGSPSYHYYMLAAVLYAVVALRGRLPGFAAESGLQSMFTAPLALMRADYSLPALNDGWNSVAMPLGLGQYAPLYEQGYGLWHDDAFADLLQDLYGHGIERTSEHALTMGPDLSRPREVASWPRRSVHPASGYAVLADGRGERERYLLVKYGPHGGGHGHPDKLQIDLHAYGVRLAPDPGSPAYTSPLQGPWIRQTLCHNTALLDFDSQPEAEGRLRGYLDPADSPAGVVDAEVSWPADPDAYNGRPGSWLKEPRRVFVPAYAGVRMRRVVLCKPSPGGYFVDVLLVLPPAGAPAVPLDLAWHHRGRLVEPTGGLDTADWDAPNETYGFLRDVRVLRAADAGRTWSAAWEIEGAGTRMWAIDPPDSRTLVATAPSNPPTERVSTVLRRAATGGPVGFAAVIEPIAGDPQLGGHVKSVQWGPLAETNLLGDGVLVSVRTDRSHDTWQLTAAGDGAPTVHLDHADDGSVYRVGLSSEG